MGRPFLEMPAYLILGAMPKDAAPQTHIAAGPWCFAGQEENFPDWENSFQFAPEPLADSSLLPGAAKAAQALALRFVPELAAYLNKDHAAFSDIYWQTLLAPWIIDVASQIVERGMRVYAMVDKWRDIPLTVPILPRDCSFHFKNEHDFTLNGALGLTFNHWLFSRILENNWPSAWQKIILPPETVSNAEVTKKKNYIKNIRVILRDFLLNLPFPRLKGLSLAQACQYSTALWHQCKTPDHSLNLKKEFGSAPKLPNCLWPQDILAIFKTALPQSIKNLQFHIPSKGKNQSHLRVASIIAYEDAIYRQKLALWRQAGNRLAYVQHGGNYGQVRVACSTAFVEYSQDVFFTWGWNKHGSEKGNFQPMPYPQLHVIQNKWHGNTSNICVFTGTEMAAYGYRLDSRPTPLQFIAYRKAKAEFFAAIGQELQKSCLYRPYFPLPGTLSDAPWLLKRFPYLRICKGPLLPQILNCKLLVLDHHGTTMLEAMAANIPMLLYWNKDAWPLTRDCEELLTMLWECGIWQTSPKEAAAKMREIWDSPWQWWQSREIQNCRAIYCKHQAMLPDGDINSIWIKTLKNL